jgi:hypothetical protein
MNIENLEKEMVKKYINENRNNIEKLKDPVTLFWIFFRGSEDDCIDFYNLIIKENLELLKIEYENEVLHNVIKYDSIFQKILESASNKHPEILTYINNMGTPLWAHVELNYDHLDYDGLNFYCLENAKKLIEIAKNNPDKKIMQTQFNLKNGKSLSLAYELASSRKIEVRNAFIEYLNGIADETTKSEILDAYNQEEGERQTVSNVLRRLKLSNKDITPAVPNTQETGKLINNNVNVSASDIINQYRKEQKALQQNRSF